jgi:hypothetical protein
MRTVFAVIDTDTSAGNDFTARAYATADVWAKQFAANFGKPAEDNAPALALAAYLSGVAYGGAQTAKNDQIVTCTAQQALDHAAYNVAASLQPPPGPNDFAPDFFTRDGPLKSPDKVPGEGAKIHYSEQLQLFVGRRPGIGAVMTQFDDQFNRAAGLV